MNFVDLFSGIGGFRLGMTMAGHTPVGWCEIDKHAQKSYRAMYDTEGEWFRDDITRVTDDDIRELGRERGQIHVITGGFPCQAFSVAGERKGFTDTRGTLFFEIMRFASILRPRYLFLENVPGLLNHDNGNTFETILRTLDEVGFDVEWDCLNTKDFGPPQNRERIFLVGHSRTERTRKIFPLSEGSQQSSERGSGLEFVGMLEGEEFKGRHESARRVYSIDGVAPCLNTCGGGGLEAKIAIPCPTPDREEKRQNGRRFKEDGEPMFTLTGQDIHGIYDGFRIRKLTPLECFRLHGFSDELFYKAQNAGISDSQLYKQAGNTVSPPVIYAIAKEME